MRNLLNRARQGAAGIRDRIRAGVQRVGAAIGRAVARGRRAVSRSRGRSY